MPIPHQNPLPLFFRRLRLTSCGSATTPRTVLRPSILSTLILATAALAQTPVPAPVPPQANPAVPGNPGIPLPATAQPAIPAVPGATAANPNPAGVPASEEMVPVQFINSDVREIVDFLQRLTGRRYIMGNQPLGNVTIHIASGGVPKSEAVKLIEMHLLMNNVVLSPSEDPNIWKVSGAGINPKSVGIPFIDREELLPANEQVVTYLFKLQWADPTELAQLIQGQILVPSQAQFTSVVPLPKANAMLVTENTALIRTLARIVRAIDVQPAEVVSEFITLEHAKAEDVVTALEKLFEKTAQQTTTPGVPAQPRVQRVNDGNGNPLPGGIPNPAAAGGDNVSIEINGGTGIGSTEDNIVVGKVKITADKRTNRIHVVARPVAMKVIKPLVKEYDVDVKLNEPGIRPLKFRPVEEVMEAVVAAIKDPGEREGGGTAGAAGATGARPAGGAQQNNFNQNSGNNRFGSTSDSGGGGTTIGESLSTGDRESTPLVTELKNGTIIGDRLTNSIVVIGAADIKEKVFSLLDQLDTRPQQVMIYTIIGELTLKDDEQFGMEYILRNGGLLNAAGTGTPATGATTAPLGFSDNGSAILNLNNLISQQNITRALTGGTSGLGGFVMAGNSFDAVLKALETTNRFRVITRPSVFTKNNKKATITSGEEVPVPTNIQSQFNNTGNNGGITSNSSIQFKPIQLRLEVVPLINKDGEVSMEIVQNISERSGSTRIDNNDIPNISQRALKTNVSVPNNSTLVLGGLIKESNSNDSGGINKLHNIPLIGPLFGKKTKNKTRTELVVMIRPVVTEGPMEAVNLRERHLEPMSIPPDLESAIFNANSRQKIPKAKVLRAAPTVRAGNPGLR
jgi:general secretion pathway protein D